MEQPRHRHPQPEEGVHVITTLLEKYGQGGNCGHLTPAYYNNGFIVGDAREAFILETVDREWVTQRIDGMSSVSNIYSIGEDALHVSDGMPDLVRRLNPSIGSGPPNYADVLANKELQHIGGAEGRRACSRSLLSLREGYLDSTEIARILRDHGKGNGYRPSWSAEECVDRRTLCMHAGGHDRPSQTVGSMISEIGHAGSIHWVTATAAPCISIFKPAFTDIPLPAHGPPPSGSFDPQSLWWRHERLHRTAILTGLDELMSEMRAERNALEAKFLERTTPAALGGSRDDRSRIIAECWREALMAEDRWYSRIRDVARTPDDDYRAAWRQMSKLAGLALPEPSAHFSDS